MSGLFGWWPRREPADAAIVRAMTAALRVDPRQRATFRRIGPIEVGYLSSVIQAQTPPRPAVTSVDGSCALWVVGDVYRLRAPLANGHSPAERPDWPRELLERLRDNGVAALRSLEGDYQVVFWTGVTRTLIVASDRFANCPLYWGSSHEGSAFASGVRGVLAAPGITYEPDLEAVREAVTFGGYRLGERTNVASVKMLPVGTALRVREDSTSTERYWSWRDAPSPAPESPSDVIAHATFLWNRACARRRDACLRGGQTLSGGRDSRAILGEVTASGSPWTAISYGVPGSDDVRLAGRAARKAGASWLSVPLYRREPSWLDFRTSQIQHTDGLIDLTDLMHLEPLSEILDAVQELTVGSYGDFVCGTTYADVDRPERALRAMPYSGAPIALGDRDATRRLFERSPGSAPSADPFLVVEHKYPQALARPATALQAWLPVRRPFVDLDLIAFWQSQPAPTRAALYERWLRAAYPAVFARIPVQKTGAPVGAGPVGKTAARAGRVIRRAARSAATVVGLPLQRWSRGYSADETEWAITGVRRRIEETILRRDSIVCGLWGRETIAALLAAWFDERRGPVQVIGALYVWESYHRDVSDHVRRAKARS